MEKTTRTILIVFFASLFSLTAIQFYLQKVTPSSVLGTTDVRGCYLLHGYCSSSTRCPSTHDAYFNPQGFIDCRQNACCVRKSSPSTPTPTTNPTRTPYLSPTPTLHQACPWYAPRNLCPSGWFWDESNCITGGDGSRNCCCTERNPLTPTPTLAVPDYSMKHSPRMGAPDTIMYAISIRGNNTPGGSKRLGGNCWYRKLLSTGQWDQWIPFDPFFTERTDWQEDYKGCFYRLTPNDQVGDTFEFAGGVTVFEDLNSNQRPDSTEPGLTCAGIDSTTRANSCQSRRVRYVLASLTPIPTSTSVPTLIPTRTPTPIRNTPTLSPGYQVENFSLRNPCGLDAFRNADYRCRTGASGSLGETSSCKPVSVWWNNVYQICNSPQPTPTLH